MEKDELKDLDARERCINEILEEKYALAHKYHQLLNERNQWEWQTRALQQELNAVYGSKKWRFSLRIGNIICFLLPHDSRRRHLAQRIYHFVKGDWGHPARRAPVQILPQESAKLKNAPRISLIMPVYNVQKRFLQDAIESVLAQTYENWELCIVDDASTKAYIRPILEHYAALDKRIKVQFSKENGHIAVASNKALKMSTGKYIAFLDNDDMLCSDALMSCAMYLTQRTDTVLLYSDNYVMDENNHVVGKMIKPNWSPEAYLATNYVVHFCVYSAHILKEMGGLNEAPECRGTQDIEIKGRLFRYASRIEHIPCCLYKWRAHVGSVSMGINEKKSTRENSIRAFQNILDQYYKFPEGQIVMPVDAQNQGNGYFTVIFPKELKPTVIIIPVALETMRNQELLDTLEELSKTEPIKVVLACKYLFSRKGSPFYRLCDQSRRSLCQAVRESGAEQVILLSNDIEKLSLESIRNLTGFAMLSKEIGACGGKILSKDMKILEGAYFLMNHLQIMHGGLDWNVTYQELCTQNCSAVTGGLMAMRASTFLKYKGLDYQRFGKLADVDLCLRMRKDGLRIVYNPRAEGRTLLPTENVMMGLYVTKEYELLYEKYQSFWGKDPYYNPSYSQDLQYVEA